MNNLNNSISLHLFDKNNNIILNIDRKDIQFINILKNINFNNTQKYSIYVDDILFSTSIIKKNIEKNKNQSNINDLIIKEYLLIDNKESELIYLFNNKISKSQFIEIYPFLINMKNDTDKNFIIAKILVNNIDYDYDINNFSKEIIKYMKIFSDQILISFIEKNSIKMFNLFDNKFFLNCDILKNFNLTKHFILENKIVSYHKDILYIWFVDFISNSINEKKSIELSKNIIKINHDCVFKNNNIDNTIDYILILCDDNIFIIIEIDKLEINVKKYIIQYSVSNFFTMDLDDIDDFDNFKIIFQNNENNYVFDKNMNLIFEYNVEDQIIINNFSLSYEISNSFYSFYENKLFYQKIYTNYSSFNQEYYRESIEFNYYINDFITFAPYNTEEYIIGVCDEGYLIIYSFEYSKKIYLNLNHKIDKIYLKNDGDKIIYLININFFIILINTKTIIDIIRKNIEKNELDNEKDIYLDYDEKYIKYKIDIKKYINPITHDLSIFAYENKNLKKKIETKCKNNKFKKK